MQFRSLALLVSLAISLTEAHIGGGSIALQDVRPQVYCGRSLSRALALLCYEDEGVEKRSDTGTMYGPVLAPYYKEHDSWPWMPPHRARSMSNQRGKRFVVSECCEKACSINELLSYC